MMGALIIIGKVVIGIILFALLCGLSYASNKSSDTHFF